VSVSRVDRALRCGDNPWVDNHALIRLKAFQFPIVKDGLVVGRQAPVNAEVLLRVLAVFSTQPFERIPIPLGTVADIIVRSAILKKISGQQMVDLLLKRLAPVMDEKDVFILDTEIELRLSTVFSADK